MGYGGRKAQELRRIVWATYPHECWLCGQPIRSFEEYEPDHVVPRSQLPPDAWYLAANARPAHGSRSLERCNSKRQARDHDEIRSQIASTDNLDWFD